VNRRREETTAASAERFGSAFAAYRSLARSRNVSLATVVDAAEKGELARIIEMRDYGAQRKIEERNTARIAYLYRLRELGARLIPPE
jgi:hypothetical protein